MRNGVVMVTKVLLKETKKQKKEIDKTNQQTRKHSKKKGSWKVRKIEKRERIRNMKEKTKV